MEVTGDYHCYFTTIIEENILKKLILVLVVLVICILAFFQIDKLVIYQANKYLDVEDIKILTPEEQIIKRLGKGKFVEGMGGYGREYSEIGLFLGFSSDSDSDAFQKVATIETENPNHAFLGVYIGDKVTKFKEVLERYRYSTEPISGIYIKREIHISFDQEDGVIKKIKIWFKDRDLKDRIY